MISIKIFSVYLAFLILQVRCFPSNANRAEYFNVQRSVRGIKDWKIFAKPTTEAPLPSTTTVKAQNNLEIGQCEEDDKVTQVTKLLKS